MTTPIKIIAGTVTVTAELDGLFTILLNYLTFPETIQRVVVYHARSLHMRIIYRSFNFQSVSDYPRIQQQSFNLRLIESGDLFRFKIFKCPSVILSLF